MYDDLTPTGELFMEALAARYRTGEKFWTFSTRAPITRAAKALEAQGLIWTMNGNVEHTFRAGLTDKGLSVAVSDNYVSPAELRWRTLAVRKRRS